MDAPELSIVIPAYNEAEGIGPVLRRLAAAHPEAEILVVDDGSTDGTAQVVESLGLPNVRVIRHPYNKGNGAAVKTGIRHARGRWVAMMDADGQHAPEDLDRLLEKAGPYDLVVGARTRQSETSWVRDLGNWVFNTLASVLTGVEIPDLTSGFRVMDREKILEFLHLLPNGYSYPTTSTLAFLKAGYNVAFVPIVARRRVGRSKVKILRDGIKFLVIILRIITLFSPLRIFLPVSLLLFLLSALSAGYTILTERLHIPNSAVLFFLGGILIFLIGLVSEQIAALRLEVASARIEAREAEKERGKRDG